MTQDEIQTKARLDALEFMAAATFNIAVINFSDDAIAGMETIIIESAARRTIETLDPAMSDHVAAEYETALRRILRIARDARPSTLQGGSAGQALP